MGKCPQYNVNLLKKAGYKNVKEICMSLSMQKNNWKEMLQVNDGGYL